MRMACNEIRDPARARFVVSTVTLRSRTFSQDVSDNRRCVGFYLNMTACELVQGSDDDSPLTLQASHADLSIGADFILFKKSLEGPFLEATFYGESLSIDQLLSLEHGFHISEGAG